MKVDDMRKLLEDVPGDAQIRFQLGNHDAPLEVEQAQTWRTGTLDAVFITLKEKT